MARRRRRGGLLDSALRYDWRIPLETQQAWEDYDKAKGEEIFAAIHRAYVENEIEDSFTLNVLRDRLMDLGLDRHAELVLGLVKAARNNHQLPF